VEGLNPSQEDCERDEHRGVQGEHCADEAALRGGLPVVAEHGNDEERDVNGHENGERAPPRINPYEAGRFRQEDFEHGEEGRVEDSEEQPVVDAENFRFGVWREQFRQGESGDGEHEAKFDADADEDKEGSAGGGGPKGVAGEMLNQSVADFKEPVDHVKGQPGGDAFPVLLRDFVGVHIDHESEQGDGVPLERVGASEDIERGFGCFRVVHGFPPAKRVN